MLETVIYNDGSYTTPSLLVLGCFDALHLGHRELLKKAKLQAKINGLDLGVMIFKDGKGGDVVLTLDERIKILESYNVKFILLAEYNEQFKSTTAAQFLKVLDDQLNLKGIMSGKDFRFGYGAKGKSATLKSYADNEDNGVWYMSVKDVIDGGVKVSTTGIKELLQSGNVAKAGELLGACYSVSGEVVHGAGRGGELIGFPTVNIKYPENKIKIKQGVYKVKSTIGGCEYMGIANYGARPTFGEQDCVLEVNYEGFNGDVYGQQITVEFVDYIRDIQTFEGAQQLAEQLEKDKRCVEEDEAPFARTEDSADLSVAECAEKSENVEVADSAENTESVDAVIENTESAEGAESKDDEKTEEQQTDKTDRQKIEFIQDSGFDDELDETVDTAENAETERASDGQQENLEEKTEEEND